MKDSTSKLITKYALILSAFYIISYAFNILLEELSPGDDLSTQAAIRGSAPWLFNAVLNLLTAVFVYIDANKQNRNIKYVILATVLFRPVGVFAFILFCILQDSRADSQTTA